MFVTGEAAPVGFGVKEVSEVSTGLLAGGGGGYQVNNLGGCGHE